MSLRCPEAVVLGAASSTLVRDRAERSRRRHWPALPLNGGGTRHRSTGTTRRAGRRPLRNGRALARAAICFQVLSLCLQSVPAIEPPPQPLRVCADPDNLPYSAEPAQGFEVRIAQLIAEALQRPLQLVWLAQRQGFVRKSMGAGLCEMFVGVPAGFERVETSRPYYRSGYVIVTRAADPAPLRSLDDPRLAALRIGVPLWADAVAGTPGLALARRGALDHVVGYTPYGDAPMASRMLHALAAGELDAALLWGPQAGWFARQSAVPLAVSMLRGSPSEDFSFSIAVGVPKGDAVLRDAVDAALLSRRAEIDAALRAFAVPRLPVDASGEEQR